MHLNAKPHKVALISGIITLILIGFYIFFDQDASQAQATSSAQPDQAPMAGTDPFKEFLDKQQQGAVIQTSPAQPSQPIQIVVGNSTTTVPVGTDPFKAFLDAQSKAKPEEAAISPFSGGK
jgi:hypothetical protein